MLNQALAIYNSSAQQSLLGLSPLKSLDPSNIAQLQAFYLRKRAEKASKYKKSNSSVYSVGQLVKIVLSDPFKVRGDKVRLSEKTYKVTHVLQSVPVVYKISDHNRVFYKQELEPSGDPESLQKSLSSKAILGIFSKKKYASHIYRFV